VDNLGKRLLARPAFASDEYRHVRGRDLRGHLNGVVQRRRIADDAKPELDGLNFLGGQGQRVCFLSVSLEIDITGA